MFRKSMAAVAVAVLLTLGGATAAFANDTGYTPHTPTTPTLAGSSAAAVCVGDVPWITYSIVMTDPDNVAKDHSARLILTKGSHSITLALGTLVDNKLSGRVLWPGAKVDAAGHAVSWPGWITQNGKLVHTNGNFAWTRGSGVSAVLEVNPSLSVPVSYPQPTAACANPVVGEVSSATILPVTGLNVPVIPIAIGGGIVLLLGAGLLLARRARRS